MKKVSQVTKTDLCIKETYLFGALKSKPMHLSNELQSPTTFSERAPIRPFLRKPGVIMAQMEKQFQEEETKILCITHISTFAITISPTLDVKKKYKTHTQKTICPHELGYSDI